MRDVAPDAAAARDLLLAMLEMRAATATLCPSEVARALVATDDPDGTRWRAAMPVVHAAVDALIADAAVRLSWQGRPLPLRAGPYRIGRADRG